jgi:hypothetical protein
MVLDVTAIFGFPGLKIKDSIHHLLSLIGKTTIKSGKKNQEFKNQQKKKNQVMV